MTIKTRFYFYFIAASLLPILILLPIFWGGLWFWVLGLFLSYVLLYFLVRRDFLSPLTDLQNWINTYNIDQSERLNDNKKTSFQPIAAAINHLIDENQHLYDDMEDVLNRQIDRMSKKSASLETLYGISAKLNKIHSIDELFKDFLQIFIDMTGASSGAARSVRADGGLHLAAISGVIDEVGQVEKVGANECFCHEVAFEEDARVQFSVHTCAKCVGEKSQQKAVVGTIFIPLKHDGKTLGVFNLFFDTEPSLAADERALFESMADNIAIALDKARLDEQGKRLELSQERLFLSQEIHDSLAQTIYSLKLQATVLGDFLKNNQQDDAKVKVADLQAHISQANQELRELMSNFRVPLDPDGIEQSLQNLLESFKSATGISAYLQIEGAIKIPLEAEMQLLRITQEALSNIKKHAKARNVRVLLLAEPHCQLLIEDDGIGLKKSQNADKTIGDNIGMKVIQERAERIGARVEIDSEAGEGTRIIVLFNKDN